MFGTKTRFSPFHIFLSLVSLSWVTYMFMYGGFELYKGYWVMSLTMMLGAFVAGSTCLGGGAVAFPVMTLVLGISTYDARDFSFMIQSVGMTSASLGILFQSRTALRKDVFMWAALGGVVGLVVSLNFIGLRIPMSYIKMMYVCIGLSFMVVLLHQRKKGGQVRAELKRADAILLLVSGFLGGAISGLTGNGVDMIVFSVLTLYFRMSLKEATALSVVLMAFISLVGFGMRLGDGSSIIQADVWNYWLVSVPVVLMFAPLGAFYIKRKNNRFITRFLILLITIQGVGAFLIIPQNLYLLEFEFGVLVVFLMSFLVLVQSNKMVEGTGS